MPRGKMYEAIGRDMARWDAMGPTGWEARLTGAGKRDWYLYNPDLELLMNVSVWDGQVDEASLHDASLDFLYALYLTGELSDYDDIGDGEPSVHDEDGLYAMYEGDAIDPREAVGRLAGEPGWAPMSQERVERAFAANYIRRLHDIGWVEDEVRVRAPEGTIVVHDSGADEEYPGVVVDLVKPDGTEGRVAMVEHDAEVADTEPRTKSPLHVLAWDGVDEDYVSEVTVDPDGPQMQYVTPDAETGGMTRDAAEGTRTPAADAVVTSANASPSLAAVEQAREERTIGSAHDEAGRFDRAWLEFGESYVKWASADRDELIASFADSASVARRETERARAGQQAARSEMERVRETYGQATFDSLMGEFTRMDPGYPDRTRDHGRAAGEFKDWYEAARAAHEASLGVAEGRPEGQGERTARMGAHGAAEVLSAAAASPSLDGPAKGGEATLEANGRGKGVPGAAEALAEGTRGHRKAVGR